MSNFNFQEFLSTFIILFAVIDILGSIPIIISLKQRGKGISASKATIISTILLIAFYYGGDLMLKLFHVDIQSFAIAGSFVIFFVGLEMLLDIEIFKNQGPIKSATLVPLVFPLVAGAGAFTTLISLRAQYSEINIMSGLILNMVWVYIVIRLTSKIENLIGQAGIYITRKFFGVILLAISVKLFVDNIKILLQ